MWDLFISVQRVIHILCICPRSHYGFAGIFVLTRDSIRLSRRSFGICPEIHLSLSRSSLNLFDFCPSGSQQFTISVQGVTTIYYFCPGGYNELVFLSRGSQWVTISVQGVTTTYYFCPESHSVFFFSFVWGVTVDHYACPGGNLAFCHLSWWKDPQNSCRPRG